MAGLYIMRSRCSLKLWAGPQWQAGKALMVVLLMLGGMAAYSQQTPVFTAYYFNRFLLNPAFAGVDNQYRAFGFYRTQWSNVPLRPVTGGATAEGSFWKDRIGAGLEVTNDAAGIFNQTTVGLSYAQKITLATNHILSIGAQGQMMMNRINFTAANPHDINDPGLAIGASSRTSFDFGLGIAYSYKNALLVGFSVPNILQPQAKYTSPGQEQSSFEYRRNYTAFVQYKISLLNGKFGITPNVLLRKAETSGYQIDGTLVLDYNNIVFAGGGYRSAFGAVFLAGVNILNTVTVAYAYDATTQSVIGGQVGQTHEVTLGFHLPSNFKAKKKSKPVVAPGPDDVVLKQTQLDSIKNSADSLAAQLAATQQALDSMRQSAAANAAAKANTAANNSNVNNGTGNKNGNATGNTGNNLSNSNTTGKGSNSHGADNTAGNNRTAADGTSGNNKYGTHQALSLGKATESKIDLTDKSAVGQNFKLDKISFEYKQYRLMPQSEEQLDVLVDLLKKSPYTHIAIKGYTDSRGSEEFNLNLSSMRAAEVAKYLNHHGIDYNRLRWEGMGSQNPVGDNNTPEGRDLNRRVEFSIDR